MSDNVLVYSPYSEVLDGNSFTVTAVFRDEDSGDEIAPSTVHYRIDCLTSGTKVQDWTAVTAGATVSITLASAYNSIQVAADESEVRQITVTGDKDLTTQCSGQAIWTVKTRNLQT